MNDQNTYTRSQPFRNETTTMNSFSFYDSLTEDKSTMKEQPQDDAQEVASFLLQLKHRSVTPEPHSHDNSEQREKPRLPVSRPQTQGTELQAPFPIAGSVFSCPPAAGFEPSYLERAPALMEEPVLTDQAWEHLIGESTLVMMKDRDLVPDALFVAMSQMRPCKLTQADRVGCYKTRELGFVGMCCKHCSGQPGFGRYYPNSVRSLAQTTTSQTILKHIGSKCRFCPPQVRQAVLDLQRQQAAKEGMSSGRPRYGSRKIFFQRMWARLHGKTCPEEDEDDFSKHTEDASCTSVGEDHFSSSVNHDSEDESESFNKAKRSKSTSSQKPKRKKSQEERETKRIRVVGI